MNEHGKISPELARRIQDDQWAKSLGIEYLELRRDYCRVALTLQPHMVNSLRSPHGSVIFALADAAFGAACNSHGAPAVAPSMTIGFLTTPQLDGRLIAQCPERRQGRPAGF